MAKKYRKLWDFDNRMEVKEMEKEYIGIIADTHDNIPLIDEAVRQLNKYKLKKVLHAGDYVSPFTINHFKPLQTEIIGVYGNNCAERGLLKQLFREIGGELRGFFTDISIKGLNIALLHGHEEDLLNSIIDKCAYDVIVHGHTHRAETYKRRRTLVINPGEVCGYLTGESTMALLDPSRLEVRVVEISP